MRNIRVFQMVLSAAALFASGLAIGLWAAMYFTPGGGPEQPAAPAASQPEAPAKASRVAAAPEQRSGPFAFHFEEGEQLTYGLTAQVTGEGMEMLTTLPVNLSVESGITLETKAVDRKGNADLRYTFDTMYIEGDFMESPFEMRMEDGQTYMTSNGEPVVDTAADPSSSKGIPQLDFFSKPIDLKVAPNGEVLKVSGVKGFENMLGTLPMASRIEFPREDMEPGEQWESAINLPIPGFGSAAPARIVNTLEAYEYIDDILCAVVHQRFTSAQKNGTLDSPESVQGEAMSFAMPTFDLDGENLVFFDTTTGRVIYSELSLDLILKIGQVLEQASSLLPGGVEGVTGLLDGSLLDSLSDPYGDRRPAQRDSSGGGGPKQQDTLLDLGLHIEGVFALEPKGGFGRD